MAAQQGTNIQSISRAMAILNYVAEHANRAVRDTQKKAVFKWDFIFLLFLIQFKI